MIAENIHTPGLYHGADVPNGRIVRGKNFFTLARYFGHEAKEADPKERRLPESLQEQMPLAFQNLQAALDDALLTWDNVVFVTIEVLLPLELLSDKVGLKVFAEDTKNLVDRIWKHYFPEGRRTGPPRGVYYVPILAGKCQVALSVTGARD